MRTVIYLALLAALAGTWACDGKVRKEGVTPGLDLRGGQAVGPYGGAGGRGGAVEIFTNASAVALSREVDLAGLPGWTLTPPDLGGNPRTLSGVATLAPGPDGLVAGDDPERSATALWVKPGARVTLVPNRGVELDPREVELRIAGALVVEGALVLPPAAPDGRSLDRAALRAHVEALLIGPRGVVEAGGLDGSAEADGGRGGAVSIAVAGDAHVEGRILAAGGRGRAGGQGGDVDVQVTSGWVVVTGEVDASGGEGLAGAGGAAGYAQVWGSWDAEGTGNLFASGTLRANGGRGTLGGGRAKWVYLSPCAAGWAAVTGRLEANGGDATVAGAGGRGGRAEVAVPGFDLWVDARLHARGGRGAGAWPGGDGGEVETSSYPLEFGSAAAPAGNVSAEVDVAGGEGSQGGAGGIFTSYLMSGEAAAAKPLRLALRSAELGGGDGAAGGAGGEAFVEAGGHITLALPGTVALGDLAVEVPLNAAGGRSSAAGAAGGAGGAVALVGNHVSSSAIAADGGASAGRAGHGGGVTIESARGPSTVGAAISVRAGAGATPAPPGEVVIDGESKVLAGGVFVP